MTDSETKKHSFSSILTLPALVSVTGILGGLGAVVFNWLIELFQRLIYFQSGHLSEIVSSVAWWRIVIGPAIGGAVVGPLVYFFAREAKLFRRGIDIDASRKVESVHEVKSKGFME